MEMTLKEVAGKIGGGVIGDASITVKTITGLDRLLSSPGILHPLPAQSSG